MLEALDVQSLAVEFALGAVLGGVVGYGFGKVARLLAIILGVQLAVFRFLESKGIVVVHWDRLTGGLVDASAAGVDQGWVVSLLSTVTVATGFAAGFLVGFKKA